MLLFDKFEIDMPILVFSHWKVNVALSIGRLFVKWQRVYEKKRLNRKTSEQFSNE